eukprot:SAG25_NODE_6328_length_569_cov_0.880851_1_plen_54_part_10
MSTLAPDLAMMACEPQLAVTRWHPRMHDSQIRGHIRGALTLIVEPPLPMILPTW